MSKSPQAPDKPAPAPPNYDHATILRIVIGLMPLLFMAALDQTVVAIALVSISRDFGQIELVPWVATGFLIASTVSTPIYGKLSDLYGRWPVLAAAIGLYLAASALSTAAQSMPQLLAFRTLQGLGGGGLIALAQTVVGDIAPGPQRGRYQAHLAGVFAIAAVSGPIIGGLLTEYLSWRAVFAINLPLGIAAFFAARSALRHLPIVRRRRPIDYAGAMLLAITLSSLLIGLTALGRGASALGEHASTLFAISAVSLAALIAREWTAAEPILPPSLFANRVVSLSCVVAGLSFFVMVGSSILLPMAMQSLHELRADQVALRMIPLSLGAPIGSILCGRLMYRMASFRTLLATGQTACLISLGILALAMPDPGFAFGALLALLGLGVGLTIPATIAAPQMAVRRELIGITTATAALTRTLGGAVGIAVLGTVLFGSLASSLGSGDALGQLQDMPKPALEHAFSKAFGLAAVISLVSMAFALAMPRRNPGQDEA